MKLVKIAGVGLNVGSITDWVAAPPSAPRDSLEVRFVGGRSRTFWDEEAIAVREWLERNSDDIASTDQPRGDDAQAAT